MRQAVRNAEGRLVCEADNTRQEVVIVIKGFKTVVRFANGQVVVENTKPAA